MSEATQLSNQQKSLMISIGLARPPVHQDDPLPQIKEKVAKKKKPRPVRLSMRPADIKWRAIRRWIKEYFLERGYNFSDYKKMYKDAQDESVDLECFKGRKITFNQFSRHANRCRNDLGIPPIIRGGLKRKIIAKFDEGSTEKKISTELECSSSHVYNTLVKAGKIKKRPQISF